MKVPKIIKTEVTSTSVSYPLVRVTFQAETGETWFGDMHPDILKVYQFKEKMSHILDDQSMTELEEVLDIEHSTGYDDGHEAGYDEASDREE